MEMFHSGKATTLVATDVAARGIHVDDVALVVHADPPSEHKAYLHRSGRTARAGNDGTVITLMTDDQVRDVRALTRAAGINPTTTRLNNATHPILAELAPGVRVEVPGGIPQSAPASNGGGGGGGRSGGGGGRNRSRSGSGTGSGNRSRSGGQPKSGGQSGKSGGYAKAGASAKSGAPANRSGARRTPSGGGGGSH